MSKVLNKEEFEDWKRQESTQSVFRAVGLARERLRDQWEDEYGNEAKLSMEESAFRSRLMAAVARAYKDIIDLGYDDYTAYVEGGHE